MNDKLVHATQRSIHPCDRSITSLNISDVFSLRSLLNDSHNNDHPHPVPI